MRRVDRQVTDNDKIDEIIHSCDCCRLGLKDNDGIYIVPLNFGYLHYDSKRVFYFHSSNQGKKIDLLSTSNYAAFELDTSYKLKKGDIPCKYSAQFQSVIGDGVISIVDDIDEKKHALAQIMEQATSETGWQFTDEMVTAVTVIKLEVMKISCKEHE